MPITRDDLLKNPGLLKAIHPQDLALLGLMPPEPAQTAEQEPTPNSPQKSTRSSTKRTGSAKKLTPSKPELQSQAEYQHWIAKLNRSLPPSKPLLALHFDPTSPTGTIPGWPDFTLFYWGSFPPLFIEFKRPRQGRLSPAQILIHRYLRALGHELHVVFSSYAAIQITGVHFELSPIHYLHTL